MGPGFGQGQSRTMDGQKHGLAGHDPITHFSCPRLPRRLCVCHPKRPTFSLTCILGAANQDASGAHPPCCPAAPSRHLNKSRVWIPSHVQDSKDRQREKKKIACMAVQLAKRSVDHRRLAIAGETGWPGVVCRRFRFRPQQGTLSPAMSYAGASRNQHVIALCHCSSAQDKMDDLLRPGWWFGPSCSHLAPLRRLQDAHTDLLSTPWEAPPRPWAGEVLLRPVRSLARYKRIKGDATNR